MGGYFESKKDFFVFQMIYIALVILMIFGILTYTSLKSENFKLCVFGFFGFIISLNLFIIINLIMLNKIHK
jgi:hypothetical protein